jgi:alpha-amylase
MHQPKRLRCIFGKKPTKSVDMEAEFFDDELNRRVFLRLAKNSYLPGLRAISQGVDQHGFKCAIGISGTLLEQCRAWCPEVIDLLGGLARSGRCEFVGQTYYHSLASLIDEKEFMQQADMHRRAIKKLFGVDAVTFKNTGLIYNNAVAEAAGRMGFRNVIADGTERMLDWRSPNYVYAAKGSPVRVLMRNYRQSDMVNFRFASTARQARRIAAKDFVDGLSYADGDLTLIEFSLETFGEHFINEGGPGGFLNDLPAQVGNRKDVMVETPSEAADGLKPVGEVDIDEALSGADLEKDLSAWVGNANQRYCFETIKYLKPIVEVSNEKMIRLWRLFTQSDNFQYMGTKGGETGAIHDYFSHFDSPVEAFISTLWAFTDFRQRLYAVAGKRSRYFRMLYGELPEGHAFHFVAGFAMPPEAIARNLFELRDAVGSAKQESIEFHLMRGDLSKWTDEILGCSGLASELRRIASKGGSAEVLRNEMVGCITAAIKEAKQQLGER